MWAFVCYDSTPVNKGGGKRWSYFSSSHVFGVGLVEVIWIYVPAYKVLSVHNY